MSDQHAKHPVDSTGRTREDLDRENAELRRVADGLNLQVAALKQRVFDLNMDIANKDMELIVARGQIESQAQAPPPMPFTVVSEDEDTEAEG